jgi:hypothetical protein
MKSSRDGDGDNVRGLGGDVMFLIGFGVLIWAAINYFAVMIFGESITEVWPLVGVSVLIFLAGWDFLPGTGRNGESQPAKTTTFVPEGSSQPK